MPSRSSERRFVLRAATADAHRALEATMGEIGSREAYLRYLAAMTRFRGAIEARLAFCDDPQAFRPTAIHPCLVQDCADLGVPEPAPMAAAIDCDGEARLGVAYVLEGSAMGATLLFRSAQNLGFDGEFGARHLSRQVERRAHWTAFLSHLEQQPALDMARVVEAANATFRFAQSAAGGVP